MKYTKDQMFEVAMNNAEELQKEFQKAAEDIVKIDPNKFDYTSAMEVLLITRISYLELVTALLMDEIKELKNNIR